MNKINSSDITTEPSSSFSDDKKNMYALLAGSLIIGIVLGIAIGSLASNKTDSISTTTGHHGSHVMQDGTSMSNSASMNEMMHEMNASLVGKKGAEFDKEFLTQMIVHHEGAVDMARLALESAERQEIKDLSRTIIDAQEKEITQMKKWLKEWFE